MARVIALTADLLFGSRLQSDLGSAGHEFEMIADPARLRSRLEEEPGPGRWVLVVDLTDPALDGSAILESLASVPAMSSAGTLGFYSHVEVATRTRGEKAGFDMLVPRSRMAREGALLVERLARVDG